MGLGGVEGAALARARSPCRTIRAGATGKNGPSSGHRIALFSCPPAGIPALRGEASPPVALTTIYEISNTFDTEGDAQSVLYEPPPQPLRYRKTMRYLFDYEGETQALDAFVHEVLLDRISQTSHRDAAPLWTGTAFILDYGMKGGALDLEKEAILSYYRKLPSPGFTLNKLTLKTRVYVFGAGADPEVFVKDIVNPAIQNAEVVRAA
jgi:hypothetical protein